MLTGRSCGSTGAMSRPPSRMRPSSGVSKPASIRSSVVLPQPLGPNSAKNSPALMSSESRSTARKLPKCLGDPLDPEQRHVVGRIGRRCRPRRRCRRIDFRRVDFRRFLGHATCQPRRGSHASGGSASAQPARNARATILWMPQLPALVRFDARQKARLCARQRKFAEEYDDRSQSAGRQRRFLACSPARPPPRKRLVTYKSLSPELAQDLAQATLADCQKRGFQVTVAVVDRFGVTQVLLRDRFAGPSHGVDRFRQGMDRGQLSHQHDRTQRHQPARDDAGRNPQPARRRHRRRRVDGRSGRLAAGRRRRLRSPGGDADEACAKAGHRRRARPARFLDVEEATYGFACCRPISPRG